MQTTPNFAVTVRAIIIDQGQLFMVKHDPKFDYYALAGGKLEIGETLEAAMARELMEETGIKAQVGHPLIVNEWVSPTNHRIEFFFWIRNAADFRHADPAKAKVTTLGEEKKVNTFFRLQNPQVIARLRDAFPDIGERPDARTVFVKLRELRNKW